MTEVKTAVESAFDENEKTRAFGEAPVVELMCIEPAGVIEDECGNVVAELYQC
ncbi:hypothetical protein [Pyrobaculum sp.]|uniref:hypothetical protein n=1 Tax=Pyrobaculum sp. TaxID=2004705 RepID=UPI003161949F